MDYEYWYEQVTFGSDGLEYIPDAIAYYKKLHAEGQQYLKMKGRLVTLFNEQISLVEPYEAAYTDISMIVKWLEETIKQKRATKRIWLMSAEGKAQFGELKKTDADTYVASDPEIHGLTQITLWVELWQRNLRNLCEELKKRGIYLTMISKVRIAGEHEAYIDTSHESDPETIG